MANKKFSGYCTALITPFHNGKLDEAQFQKNVDWQIKQGIHGLVPCGTTGETPTLTHDEDHRLIELCLEAAAGRVPVMAGCGSNATAEAVSRTQAAQKLGVNAALHVMPYYNKPTPEGQYRHFKAIHDASDLPIYIYNIPGRSVVTMSHETMARLSELPRIAGVKDATGDILRPVHTRAACGKGFTQLTGEDGNVLAFLAQGGHGCISVTSNIAPKLCADLYNAWAAGDVKTAQALNDRLMPLHDALFIETSPGPVKYAASLLGLCRYEFRLPLVPITKAHEQVVEEALRGLEVWPLAA